MTNECIGMNKSILISNKQIKKKKKENYLSKNWKKTNQSNKQIKKTFTKIQAKTPVHHQDESNN